MVEPRLRAEWAYQIHRLTKEGAIRRWLVGGRYLAYALLLWLAILMALSIWRYATFSPLPSSVPSQETNGRRIQHQEVDATYWPLIGQQNWFGKYQPVVQGKPKPQVVETRLNVILRGIAYGAYPGAVIEEGGKQQFYSPGEALATSGAVIDGIYRDHVMLRYHDRLERLSMSEEVSATQRASTILAPNGTSKPRAAAQGVASVGEVPQAVRQTLARDPQKIFNYIQLSPVQRAGIVGYEVKPGADRSLFDASGFKVGDIAIALNQQAFTQQRAIVALMRQLPTMSSIQLTVLRNGSRHDIVIALH